MQDITEKMAAEAKSEEMLKKIQDYLSQATEQVWIYVFVCDQRHLLMFSQTLSEVKCKIF